MRYDLEEDPPPSRLFCAIAGLACLAWTAFCLYWMGRGAWAVLLWLNNHL